MPGRTLAGPDDQQITRIPVGLAAYCAPAACLDDTNVGCAALRGLRPDDTAISDFRLAALGGSTVCELAGLQLRPAGRAEAPMRQAHVPGAGLEHVDAYTVEWAASGVAATPLLTDTERGTRVRAPSSWSVSDNWDGAVWRSGNHAATAAGQLRSLQTQLATASAVPLCLRTVGTPSVNGGPGRVRSCDAVASGWAMWRVAAQEQSGARLEAYGFDPNATQVPERLPATDSFGACAATGVWLAPHLTSSRSSEPATGSTAWNAPGPQLTGCVLVTGGLGNLGLLAGLWAAETYPTAQVILIGRSGRGAVLPAAAGGSSRLLTAVRCDVACAEELAAVVTELQLQGVGPVQAALHAGGDTQVGGPSQDRGDGRKGNASKPL